MLCRVSLASCYDFKALLVLNSRTLPMLGRVSLASYSTALDPIRKGSKLGLGAVTR